jgi:hypothetical protein
MATIEVGNEDQMRTFHVHKALLSFYPGYFRAAPEGSWVESSSGVIKLKTEDPLVFKRFFLWLYTNKITDDTLEPAYSIAIDLWLFADRRNIPLLMNEMINTLHQYITGRWTLPVFYIHKVYENTNEGSTLRRSLMWSMSRTMEPVKFHNHQVENWPREALSDMLRLVLADRPASSLSKDQHKNANMCPAYHVHEDGALCTDKLFT